MIKYLFLVFLLFLGGCKPYDTPEYVEIKNNETAFMVPMEGATNDQTSFESEAFLKQNLVATKRIRIPHRWSQRGRMWWSGEYLDTVRVITVDRTPVNRYWTGDSNGSNTSSQAIDVETNDSVSLSMDITCTGYIEPEDAPKFLYMYPAANLTSVMDNEVRARVQTELTREVAKYSLEEVKFNKAQIIDPVKESVSQFFKARGITLSTLGNGGGINYKNPKIQEAIDKTVQDQQLAISAEARYQAQLKENQTIKAKAEADAQAVLTAAEGQAKGIRVLAEAKAFESEQSTKGGSTFLRLRELDVMMKTLEQWDGRLPMYNMGNGQTPHLLMQLPENTIK